MPINFLEQLVAEWYEYRGFFVRRNVNVGKRTAGGHEGELDVVAFHPVKKLLVQIETSMDAESWAQREQKFKRKFTTGKKHIPMLFSGFEGRDAAVLRPAARRAAASRPRGARALHLRIHPCLYGMATAASGAF